MYTRSSYGSYGQNTPNAKFMGIMEKIENYYKQPQLQLLLYLNEMCFQNFSESLARTKIPQPFYDENLNSTIMEKLLAIKEKNHELKIRILNMQASLAKQNSNNRKVTLEKKYQETMDQIKDKSFGIREKLSKLKRSNTFNRKVINCEADKTKTVMNELKNVTEMLSYETVKVRAEFSALKDMFPDNELQ